MLPPIPQDTTDRNRTSPMAFTGNKFEFRMLGSSQSVSGPNIALNAIMADELQSFADELEGSENFNEALHELIQRTFREHQRIIFNGNGYDNAWVEEAKQRGLSNLASTPDAVSAYENEKNLDVFVRNGVYSKEELIARANIHVETYNATIAIEARTMMDMIRRQILPAVSNYASVLCDRIQKLKAVGWVTEYETDTSRDIALLTDKLMKQSIRLGHDMDQVPADSMEAMHFYHDTILPDMAACRESADSLELLMDKEYWPFPTYAELLFSE